MNHWHNEVEAIVLYATFSNPPRNFLTFAVLAELGEIIQRSNADELINVIVLRSAADGYFAAHADLDDLMNLATTPVPEARSWYTTLRAIDSSALPVVAAVDGQAWGGGLELLLCCTICIASPRASFSFPETALGIIPGAGGTQRAPRRIGPGRVADLILTGRVIDASEALRIGLIDLVIDSDFDTAVREYAASIARKPRAATVAAKQSIDDARTQPLLDGLRAEGARFSALLASEASGRRLRAALDRYRNAGQSDPVFLEDLQAT